MPANDKDLNMNKIIVNSKGSNFLHHKVSFWHISLKKIIAKILAFKWKFILRNKKGKISHETLYICAVPSKHAISRLFLALSR